MIVGLHQHAVMCNHVLASGSMDAHHSMLIELRWNQRIFFWILEPMEEWAHETTRMQWTIANVNFFSARPCFLEVGARQLDLKSEWFVACADVVAQCLFSQSVLPSLALGPPPASHFLLAN